MTLDSFGNQLKKYRLEKHLSLQEVSAKTKISMHLLEAMEKGHFSLLPQPYIRAFIREYAFAIETNPEELLNQYETAKGGFQPPVVKPASLPDAGQEVQGETNSPAAVPGPPLAFRNKLVTAAMVLIPLALFALILFQGDNPETEPVKEVPFDRAIEENEAKYSDNQKSTTPQQGAVFTPVAGDSLRLEIITTDTVWVSLTIDNSRRGEYLFPPNTTRSWAGKEQFVLSVGNAGAAVFRLNGKEIGSLGRPGTIARSILITAQGILLPE